MDELAPLAVATKNSPQPFETVSQAILVQGVQDGFYHWQRHVAIQRRISTADSHAEFFFNNSQHIVKANAIVSRQMNTLSDRIRSCERGHDPRTYTVDRNQVNFCRRVTGKTIGDRPTPPRFQLLGQAVRLDSSLV